MKFNEKIVKLRKMKGLTQDEFASAVGVSRQAVYKWESGQSYPEVAKLLEIKLLFNISIDDLLDDGYEIEMPEKPKKKRERTVKAAPVAKEEPVFAEEKEPEEEAAEPVPVGASIAAEAAAEKAEEIAEEAEPEVEEKTEEIPAAEEQSAEETAKPEKKKGFFGRLFGRK